MTKYRGRAGQEEGHAAARLPVRASPAGASMAVGVCQAAVMELPETEGLKQQAVISHRSRGWKVKGEALADSASGGGPLRGSQAAVFSLSSHGGKGDSSPGSFIRTLIPA